MLKQLLRYITRVSFTKPFITISGYVTVNPIPHKWWNNDKNIT